MEHLIEIKGLRKHYDGFKLEVSELIVDPGNVVGFVGSNGAGKTSTLKALLGIIRADEGTVKIFGTSPSDARSFGEAKSRVGVVLDTCPFPPDLTVKDMSSIGRSSYANWKKSSFTELADRFDLHPKKRVSELSRGMGMKLQLAFALAHDPDLLILDEPTAGLDPIARLEVLDLLRSCIDDRRGALISTHITSDLEKVADYVVCIDSGHIAFSESIDAICDQAGVLACRASELEKLCHARLFEPGELRIVHEPYSTKALIPDRHKLAKTFPELTCERATVESYMTLMLKGEPR